MNALGIQLLLDLKECNREILNDLSAIKEALIHAAQAVGATIVGDAFHKFSPHGVTGVLAIAESHLCIHTWPEHGYAAVDIFTCGDAFDPRAAAHYLIQRLQSQEPSIVEMKRGFLPQPSMVSHH